MPTARPSLPTRARPPAPRRRPVARRAHGGRERRQRAPGARACAEPAWVPAARASARRAGRSAEQGARRPQPPRHRQAAEEFAEGRDPSPAWSARVCFRIKRVRDKGGAGKTEKEVTGDGVAGTRTRRQGGRSQAPGTAGARQVRPAQRPRSPSARGGVGAPAPHAPG